MAKNTEHQQDQDNVEPVTNCGRLHSLPPGPPPPAQFTYPFCYTPHPLCRMAASMVQTYIKESGIMQGEHGCGKMFGVLVVELPNRQPDSPTPSLAFVAAYSGLLSGRNDWPYFVPPVFDAQRPDGHFKLTEREISAINQSIAQLERDPSYVRDRQAYAKAKSQAEARIAAMRADMLEAKSRRDARRAEAAAQGTPLSDAEQSAMIRQSQHAKAELRRLRQHTEAALQQKRAPIDAHELRLAALRHKRKQMSDALQQWLFGQYRMLNARGEERDLTYIFGHTINAVPPAGSGDCCAPKLLQYAYRHHLRPVCMAEFWWGDSPGQEIRHHGHYYPACRSKCLPILTHMLQGLDVEPNPLARPGTTEVPTVVYDEAGIIVVNKPAGMLSVPGRDTDGEAADKATDAETYIDSHMRAPGSPFRIKAVHRLDMDTSGLLVLARTPDTYRELQRQFAARETRKRYEAVLDGTLPPGTCGTIELPMRPDVADRPRQCVDTEHGKPAVTTYKVVDSAHGRTLVWLCPHTGRTHQLRVHCAHKAGLGTPILGDPLYGRGTAAPRMYLHAAMVEFCLPGSGKRIKLESASGFETIMRQNANKTPFNGV